MARAFCYHTAINYTARGAAPLSGAVVYVYEPGTTDLITETLYAHDDDHGTPLEELSNPLTTNTQGEVEFWLADPKKVDLYITYTGKDPDRVPYHVTRIANDGTNGINGTDGDSAYEIAVANGFVGNEAAWIASLEGPQGDPGDDGVISEVQNEGTPLADQPIMNFTGTGVDVTVAGGKYEVNVPGGSHPDLAAHSAMGLATDAEVAAAISAVIDAAPGALDTLNELAAALGDDANFASTVTTALAGKQAISDYDAKGDLIVGTGADAKARKAVGADGTFIQADSSTSDGLVYRAWATAEVLTDQSTTSTTFADLATGGPAVTVTIGPSGAALVILQAGIYDGGGDVKMGFVISGATTRAASDNDALIAPYVAGSLLHQAAAVIPVSGLTPGANNFTTRYRTTSGTARFLRRRIVVIPL